MTEQTTEQETEKRTATHCCVCRRKLTDPESVLWGIGPVCRKRLGIELESVSAVVEKEDTLKRLLTACSIAAREKRIYDLFIYTAEIRHLGFDSMAHEIEREYDTKKARILIVRRVADELRVRTPTTIARLAFKDLGGIWDPKAIEWVLPASKAHEVNELIGERFQECIATSVKGVWIVGKDEKPQPLHEERNGRYVTGVDVGYLHNRFALRYGSVRAY